MNLKVAVVDDEAPIRQWLTYCIGTIAPEDKISTAANGAEALEMMEQVQPDIVFTDICMPVMDGLELMRQAKKKLPGSIWNISEQEGIVRCFRGQIALCS